ncbi:I66 family serine proteinase inhibitor [Kitasatospora sp. NPDC004615]|uniref:I66 family serine proteinase inhibitor n=1 Tax=Kitasatospora sp. NPDC004615 TaxID=3364017 RepID=UPI0036AE7E6F
MGLESGYYTIQNGQDLVGRRGIEDLSLRPKAIINQAGSADRPWVVEALPNGLYSLSAKGTRAPIQDNAGTAIEDNKLVALLMDPQYAVQWQLVAVNGKNDTYRIVEPRGGSAWMVREPGKESQVEVLNSITGSASDAFTFKRVTA